MADSVHTTALCEPASMPGDAAMYAAWCDIVSSVKTFDDMSIRGLTRDDRVHSAVCQRIFDAENRVLSTPTTSLQGIVWKLLICWQSLSMARGCSDIVFYGAPMTEDFRRAEDGPVMALWDVIEELRRLTDRDGDGPHAPFSPAFAGVEPTR